MRRADRRLDRIADRVAVAPGRLVVVWENEWMASGLNFEAYTETLLGRPLNPNDKAILIREREDGPQ